MLNEEHTNRKWHEGSVVSALAPLPDFVPAPKAAHNWFLITSTGTKFWKN